jgi:hypothetical protein
METTIMLPGDTFLYLRLDGVAVSGNRFRRVRYVDMKHEFAFVVSNFSCSP